MDVAAENQLAFKLANSRLAKLGIGLAERLRMANNFFLNSARLI